MRLIMISDTHGRPGRLQRRKTVSQSSELNRIALDYLRRLRAEGLKSTKVEVLKPYDKRTDKRWHVDEDRRRNRCYHVEKRDGWTEM